MATVPTTDEVDHITPEERNALMGFCERDEKWYKFTREIDTDRCPDCGSTPSNQIGFQILSQRTFNPLLHGKKKRKK